MWTYTIKYDIIYIENVFQPKGINACKMIFPQKELRMSIVKGADGAEYAGRKDAILLTVLCAGAYFASYMTRINYKAVVAAVVESEGITKDLASVALTGLAVTYGLGQLVSGWLGDRINPKYLMSGGLILASLMNVLMPLCPNVGLMTAVWCVNGLGQAMMWPPIVKTLTTFLSDRDYLHASVKVSWGSAFATILIYLTAPWFVVRTGWRTLFYLCAGIGVAGAAVIYLVLGRFDRKYPAHSAAARTAPGAKTAGTGGMKSRDWLPAGSAAFFAVLLTAIIIQGVMRDGVDTWMPSYVSENFGLGTDISILSGVILPVFTLISYQVATFVYEKLIKNEMLCAAAVYVLAVMCSLALLFFRKATGIAAVIASVFLLATVVGCMHAVNLIFTCFIPRRFKRFGHVSWVSGLTNFGTYAGSALSAYGFAALTEKSGWGTTVVSWAVISALGAAVSLSGLPLLLKVFPKEEEAEATPQVKPRETPPAGSQETLPAGSQETPPAGSQETAPAGSQETPPAGSQKTPPAGSQETPPAGSQVKPQETHKEKHTGNAPENAAAETSHGAETETETETGTGTGTEQNVGAAREGIPGNGSGTQTDAACREASGTSADK